MQLSKLPSMRESRTSVASGGRKGRTFLGGGHRRARVVEAVASVHASSLSLGRAPRRGGLCTCPHPCEWEAVVWQKSCENNTLSLTSTVEA